MKIDEIFNTQGSEQAIINALMNKTINVPIWGGKDGLCAEYDPRLHPVMDKAKYPDIVTNDGIKHVVRITLGFQQLAVKRMTELMCGIQVKRVYRPANERQQKISGYIENIYKQARIDSVNISRMNMLFASCEVFTLWYAVEERHSKYGFTSPLKMRCVNYSPMQGDNLYPLFDEYGDMIAMSVGYTRLVNGAYTQFFDCYTSDRHVKWSFATGEPQRVQDEDISTIGKIPGVYVMRPTPIWEHTSGNVFEAEWALSRDGNYLRDNSKPKFVVFADDVVRYGDERDSNEEFKAVMQYPANGRAEYITWNQAIDNLKYYVDNLRNLFFTQLQLPDWSYEKMSQQALSGESRKQMFIDAQLKVTDESGRWIEAFDRENNVVKAYLKTMLPESYHADIDALFIENIITPYTITDKKDTINNLLAANGNKPIMSQRESIEAFGYSDDASKTMREIAEEDRMDALELSE